MRVFMIGGTGLLGSEAARELIARGHDVTTLALPGLPPGAQLPETMQLHFGNYLACSDDALVSLMHGADAFVFAAGVDERVEAPAPAYAFFAARNNAPLERLLRLAKTAGVKHAVVLGSYFTYFDRMWPEQQLARWHPYIRSRVDQARLAYAEATPEFDVAVLELPYIFGSQPGRKPVWVFLVELLRKMPLATFYPKGGTAMVTVRQCAQAIAGALEQNRGAHAYPLGWFNLTWKAWLKMVHRALGQPHRPVVTIPDWMFKIGAGMRERAAVRRGAEGGLDLVRFASVMSAHTFIDRELAAVPLGVTDDDLEKAVSDSIRQSAAVIGGAEAIGMSPY